MYHNIRLYPFDTDENDDEEVQLNEQIRVRVDLLFNSYEVCPDTYCQNMIPFAVVGSERNVIIEGKPVRGRKNRWGVINVEDEKHCEFVYLRNFLTRYAHFMVPEGPHFYIMFQNTPPGLD